MDLDDGLDDDLVDGCHLDMEDGALAEGEDDLFVLFAEALDPDSPVTVEQVKNVWGGR